MSRTEKKCLLVSSGIHGFLLLLLVFGSAFFVAKEKPFTQPKLQFYPSKFVESALAGGGGNPNLPRTEDVQKGLPSPAAPVTAPPPQPQSQQKPTPQALPPPPKPEPASNLKKPAPKPVETAKPKPAETEPQPKFKVDLNELKPVTRTEVDKRKQQADAEAAEAARQQALARRKLAQQIGRAADVMQRGFASGTKVDVGGPGGEAYGNYSALVQAAYDDAWKVLPDLSDDDWAVTVRVTIARNG